MDAKEYLSSLRRIDAAIKQKKQELNGLRLTIAGPAATDYSRPKATSGPRRNASYADGLAAIEALEEEVMHEIVDFAEKKHKIICQIQGLADRRWAGILFKRYVEYKGLEAIAIEMGYTHAYVRKVHGKALSLFQKKYLTN